MGLPKGVFNMVTGLGPVVGEAIVAHPKTDMVSFTGSTRAGKRVMQIAAEMVKRVSLELGGKSANIILEDADFAKAVADGVFKCYLNSGQTCSALTRMVVPRSRLAEVEDLAVAAAAGLAPATRSRVEPARTPRERGPAAARARLHQQGYRRRRATSSAAA